MPLWLNWDVIYMEQAIKKADALIEAMEYISLFTGKIVLVKLGGSILENPDLQKKLLTDIVFMATVGIRPIIVHGGGKAITKAMSQAGLEPQWVNGRRYTDERTLTIVEHTLIRQVNAQLCRSINELGCEAMGLHSMSSCILTAEKLRLDGQNGRKIDLGFVGTVTAVNAELLKTLCASRTIPVIAPVAMDKAGGKLNVNADSAAAKVAAEARKIANNYPGASGSITLSADGDRVSGDFEVWKVVKDGDTYKFERVKVISL